MTDTPGIKWARLKEAATEREPVKERFHRNVPWSEEVSSRGRPLLLFSDVGTTGGAALHAVKGPSFDLHVRWAADAAKREAALHAAAAWLSERFGVPTNVMVDDQGAHLEVHGDSLPINDALMALDSLRWIATGAEGRRDPFSVLGDVSMGGLPDIELGDEVSVIAADDWGLAYVLAETADTLFLQRRFGADGRPESLLLRRMDEGNETGAPTGFAERIGYPLSQIRGERAEDLLYGAGLDRGFVWRMEDGGVLGHDDARRVIERAARFWNNQAALDAAGFTTAPPRFEPIGTAKSSGEDASRASVESMGDPAAQASDGNATRQVGTITPDAENGESPGISASPRSLAGHNPYLSKSGESRPLYSSLARDQVGRETAPASPPVAAEEIQHAGAKGDSLDGARREPGAAEPPERVSTGVQRPRKPSLDERAEIARLEAERKEEERASALDVLKQRFEASEGAAAELPSADAEGLFDVTLVTPGFDPGRTAHLLSIVLGIDRIEAEEMCQKAPSRILSGVCASEVRRIDSVVRPASGARFDASNHEEKSE